MKLDRKLQKHLVTTSLSQQSFVQEEENEEAIYPEIENSDIVIVLITPDSAQSENCLNELTHAQKFNKRILYALLKPTAVHSLPEQLRNRELIDISSNPAQVTSLLNVIKSENEYYYQHKTLLVQALKWKRQNNNVAVLLRGNQLEKALQWLIIAEKHTHSSTPEQKSIIQESEARKGQLGSEVFISYSRTDGDFARRLNNLLQQNGHTTWFDQESIPATAPNFWQQIQDGIRRSNNFVFIISHESVASEYCKQEVNFAKEHGKRIITINYRKADEARLKAVGLATIQWINFEGRTDYSLPLGELSRALAVDRKYIDEHTFWGLKAQEWLETNRDKGSLLSGVQLELAYSWLKSVDATNQHPSPTSVQRELIINSQKTHLSALAAEKRAKRRLKLFNFLSVGTAIVAIVFGGYAYIKYQQAETLQRKVETALFDMAIRKRFPEWEGYNNYPWNQDYNPDAKKEVRKGNEILAQVDSLDLSNFALNRIPIEIIHCPNLKHLNLLYNYSINWKKSEETLKRLKDCTGLYVSISNLNDIDDLFWHNIIGIHISDHRLTFIPNNILQQRQLRYLDLGGQYKLNTPDTSIRQLLRLNQLNQLKLSGWQIKKLPPEIGQLKNLRILNLTWTKQKTLPSQIGQLKNLSVLDLTAATLESIPPQIGQLEELNKLYLSGTDLTNLPSEIGRLKKLKVLELNGNKLNRTSLLKAAKTVNPQIKKELASYAVNTGLNFYANNKSDSAHIYFLLATEIDSSYYWAWRNLGISYRKERNLYRSLVSCRKAIEIGNNSDIHNVWSMLCGLKYDLGKHGSKLNLAPDAVNIGINFNREQKVDSALHYFSLATKIDSSYYWGWRNLGLIYQTQGMSYLAINSLKKAHRIGNDDDFHSISSFISHSYYDLKRYSKAIWSIEMAIRFAPDNTEYYQNLSWYSIFARDFKKAIWAGEQYMKRGKPKLGGISNLCLSYLWNGNWDKSKQLYNKHKEEGKEVFYADIKAVLIGKIPPKNPRLIVEAITLLNSTLTQEDKQLIQKCAPNTTTLW